jgi:hypothetical protein
MRITRKAGKINALKHAVTALDGAQGRVGWFPSAIYEGGAPVAGVAYVQEFGSPAKGIPPRMGMRAIAEEKRQEWAGTAREIARAAAQGKLPADNVMPAVCLAAEGAMRARITKVNEPPLKQATIDARKRRLANGGEGAKASIAKPLVDTGILLNTLTSETTKK